MDANEQMDLEIRDAIKKNLSNQVGEVLKQKLDQADRDARAVKELNQKVSEWVKLYEDAKKTISTYQAFDVRNATLEQREKEVAEKERDFKLHTLEYQLNAERERTKFAQDVAMGLVRNTEYKKAIYDSEMKNGYYDNNGKWVDPQSVTKTYTETTEKK